jgi:hypothetical protein
MLNFVNDNKNEPIRSDNTSLSLLNNQRCFDRIVLESSLNLHNKIYNLPVKNYDIQDSKIFISSYTERSSVIREEIRVGNLNVSNSASKKNCLIMAV